MPPAADAAKPLKNPLREPFVQFLLLGAVIFALHAWRESRRPAQDAARRIDVTAGVIERLRAGHERQFGKPPDADELRGLVAAHVRQEVLYREALALGLDRDDTIVRQRLAQKMEFLTQDVADAAPPDEETLKAYFAANAERFARPGRMSFRHVYFSREKRGAEAETAAREALAALASGASEEALGDAFLHGYELDALEPADVAALFGPEFALGLTALPAGEWGGPIASSYGVHLVRLLDREPPRAVTLDEARPQVERDFLDERRREANREVFEKLREQYEVSVDEAALAKALSPSGTGTE